MKRRVALKIIKAGMDTRRVIARFEAERQIMVTLHDDKAVVKAVGGADHLAHRW